MEVQSRLKSAVSAAKTRSKLSAELAVARDEHARSTAAWKEVEGLRPPEPVLLEEEHDARGTTQHWGMGAAAVMVPSFSREGFGAERQRALLSSWQNKRYRERGFERPPYSYKQHVDDLTKRLATIERKIKALTF